MDHQDVGAAVAEMLRVCGPHTAEDWTVPAGPLEWTCWQTAAHIGHDLLAYAGQLAAQPADAYLPIDLNVRPTASPAEVLQAVNACGGLLSSALATADPPGEPTQVLLWCTGRGELDGLPRRTSWRWEAARSD
ncbi:hypothetical protein GCM10010271_32390 [Streptomyces kurssanovii]|nr:hypothetical protein GCM10010271_32390 [Streptomyces kurssanovii]